MENLIHMTGTYSNALLVAVLMHVSDFAEKLELPIAQPITQAQVQRFIPSEYKNYVAGAVILTNGYRFTFAGGYVAGFQTYSNGCYMPEDWGVDDYPRCTNFFGTMKMTTNEVIELARTSLQKLGYDLKKIHADRTPTAFSGPMVIDQYGGGIIPCCTVEWRSEGIMDKIRFSINAETKQVLGYSLASPSARRPDPKLDVEPELEKDYRKRVQGTMFKRTNAPPRLQSSPEK